MLLKLVDMVITEFIVEFKRATFFVVMQENIIKKVLGQRLICMDYYILVCLYT